MSTLQPVSGSGAAAEHTCPECGRAFPRAASLGAHRKRSHGIAGTTRTPRTPSRVDRDELLRLVFPAGIPPREDVLRATKAWLDQAERLAAQG